MTMAAYDEYDIGPWKAVGCRRGGATRWGLLTGLASATDMTRGGVRVEVMSLGLVQLEPEGARGYYGS